jgi:hypothetical protein
MGFIALLPVVVIGRVSLKNLLLMGGLFFGFGVAWVMLGVVFSKASLLDLILVRDLEPGAIPRGLMGGYTMMMTVLELLPFAVARRLIERRRKPNNAFEADAPRRRAAQRER